MQGTAKRAKAKGTQGALRATAKRQGALTKKGTIKVSWLRQQAKKNTLTGKRARLALRYRESNQKRG